MNKYKVVVSDNRHGDYSIETEVLKEANAEVVVANCFTVGEMIETCKDADGILLDMAPLTGEVIMKLEKCKVVSRYGVGYDNVKVDVCTQKGIYVANVPDYCAEDVSDHALALLLACVRNISLKDRLVRLGKWNVAKEGIRRIKGKTFAIMGFGMIARRLCQKLAGLGLGKILVYDPYIAEEQIASYGAVKVNFEQAIKDADYISLHMPVTSETKNLINCEAISRMKSNVIIINTSRGQLIDDAALIDALKNRKIGGAGLDTHHSEPLPENSPYFVLDNCILTDHTAYFSEEAIIELKTKAAENIRDVLLGGKPRYPVNAIG